MSNTTNISLRVDTSVLERIDQAASQEGLTRTQYILNWLPASYDRDAEPRPDQPQQAHR